MTFSGDMATLLGYAEAELDGGWARWLELVHPEDRAVFDKIAPALAAGEPFHLNYRLVRKDGTFASVRDDGSAIVDSRTGCSRLAGILFDISQQQELSLQLQHAQKMEAFGRLAGGVAHDFNNLLTVFAGYTEMLDSEMAPADPRRDYLNEMRRAGERASSLTSQLLAFSRMQYFSPRSIDLGHVVLEMRKMMRRLIGEDIELVTDLAEDLGSVMTDPRQIETVLINLAVNARDAMPRGGRLLLETANVQIRPNDRRVLAGWKPGSYVQIAVTDTGCGMDEAVRNRIFEPFFTTKEPGHGTGLGLSTCYGIVQQSAGQITVESTPGKGTTFRIFLPRIRKAPGKAKPEPQAAIPRGAGETVLLVDDDAAVKKIHSTLLKSLGYEVLNASNGEEALRVAGNHLQIRLVITDMVMPLMNGTDLAGAIRDVLPQAKVLLTSGYASEPDLVSGGAARTRFLPKPLTRNILAHTLRELLDAK